jgi:hypothetical protein
MKAPASSYVAEYVVTETTITTRDVSRRAEYMAFALSKKPNRSECFIIVIAPIFGKT